MKILSTRIDGLKVIEGEAHKDSRGIFERIYCNNELGVLIDQRKIVQINVSQTFKVGAIRGLHYQHQPHAEMKLVRCLKGKIWDVAIDLRTNSDTYLQWHSEELSYQNSRTMVIPEGFAHGFQVLEPDSMLLYLHTAFYNPYFEAGLAHDDPSIGIKWPLVVTDLSDRDKQHQLIDFSFQGINV